MGQGPVMFCRVSSIMSSWGSDMSADLVVAEIIHHGSSFKGGKCHKTQDSVLRLQRFPAGLLIQAHLIFIPKGPKDHNKGYLGFLNQEL